MANESGSSGGVFISYRRRDSAPFAGRLVDYLSEAIGESQVFIDVAATQPGVSFADVIEQAVNSSTALIVLIGPEWLTATDESGHRQIDNPDDLVRREIATALRNRVRTIPVLVGGASLPAHRDLPIEVSAIANLNSFRIGTTGFRDDAASLVSFINGLMRTEAKRAHKNESLLVPRKRVFISYSHKDKYWLDRLLVHLRPLERQGRIEPWSDIQIRAGDEWTVEIKKAIEAADAAVLLVSADFMASDFIQNDELALLLEAAKEKGVKIIPLLVSSSSYEDSSLARFQAINPPSEALDLLSKGQQEAYFLSAYRAVKDALHPEL